MMQFRQPLKSSRNTTLPTPAPHFSKEKNDLARPASQLREQTSANRKRLDPNSEGWIKIFQININRIVLITVALLSLPCVSSVQVSSDQTNSNPATSHKSAPVLPHRYHTKQVSNRAQQYYSLVWGIDSLMVKSVESGELIKFTYRVINPNKARVLNDKKNEPFLVDPRAGVKLVVPSLEKVGQLRQSSTPEAGKVYWMAFSNKGRLVRPGDFVDVSIGLFRASGLIVQ